MINKNSKGGNFHHLAFCEGGPSSNPYILYKLFFVYNMLVLALLCAELTCACSLTLQCMHVVLFKVNVILFYFSVNVIVYYIIIYCI